jgi:transglutaminase-like putative cysteine protease
MVATTPRQTPYVPWYLRWELPTVIPGALLALIMVWSVIQSIILSNWASGLEVLASIAAPGLLVGIIFARLRWLPGWLAHLLSAALGVAWAIQRIGPLLAQQIAQELDATLIDRLATWNDRATEILIRVVIWLRVLQSGGRGEDIVLFVVALALLTWALGYTTGWLLFRSGWVWWAVMLNAIMILVNYTYAMPKPNTLFFMFLATALLLVVHQNVIHKQQIWSSALVEYPEFLPWRFLVAAALFCGMVILFTSLLPGNVSSVQVARAWQVVTSPLTAVRERWEDAFSTINAPPGTAGGGFATRGVHVAGARTRSDAVVMTIRSSKFEYWRGVSFDRYTGQGWQSTVGERARAARNVANALAARTPVEPGVVVPQIRRNERTLVTETVQLVQPRADDLLMVGGEFSSAGLPVLIQHGFVTNESGQPLPNLEETAAVYAQVPLQATQTYTVAGLISTADVQSLRSAGNAYPSWVSQHYLELPSTIPARVKAQAQEIVQQAGATNPYDQAIAIQDYLRRLPYDETRPAPPENRDWVDYFLFDSQRGYCDDFASAMVVLLRSLNVPARWSQGYAGGTLDPEQNAYVVRESIAHSWPEVYFPDFGWQRFEPTPASYAATPDRPAQPNAADSADTAGGGGSGVPLDIATRNRLALLDLEDRLNSAQGDLTASLQALEARKAAERTRQFVILGGVIAALLAGIVLFIISLRRDLNGLSPASAAYARLGRFAAWAGLPQEPHYTPYEYAGELARGLPTQRAAVEGIVGAYVAERYGSADGASTAELKQHWRSLRLPLLTRLMTNLSTAARPQPQRPSKTQRSAVNRRRRPTNRRR